MDAENIDISPTDFGRLIKFARENNVGLTVVGPEAPLVGGIVDAFQKEKLKIFGPSKLAAELEGSKVFCKNLLRQADVPTADYQVFRDPQRPLHCAIAKMCRSWSRPTVWPAARVCLFAAGGAMRSRQ